MKLLVYEHVSAGGLSGTPGSPSVLSEGFGMLRTFVADAKSAGNTVTTVLDRRIADFKPPLDADHVIIVQSPAEAENVFLKAAENSDAAYVIAPETNRTLKRLVEKIEQSQTVSLNSESEAIAKASDKPLLQKHAGSIGLSTPETMAFSVKDKPINVIQTVKEKIGFPTVFKPVDSVGCEALSIVNNEKQAKTAITKISRSAKSRFMAQRLICGTAASVTLISNGTEAQPITLNEQNVSLKTPSQESCYKGGTTPLSDEQEASAFAAAKNLIESIHGLRGYIGVDFVLTKNEPVMIEVNPRLTTSYIGIRKTIKLNLTQAVMDATLEHELPAKPDITGYTHLEIIKTPNPTNAALLQTFNFPEVVSPPFPHLHGKYTYALICTYASTPQLAKRHFNKAEKQLQVILSSGGKS